MALVNLLRNARQGATRRGVRFVAATRIRRALDDFHLAIAEKDPEAIARAQERVRPLLDIDPRKLAGLAPDAAYKRPERAA